MGKKIKTRCLASKVEDDDKNLILQRGRTDSGKALFFQISPQCKSIFLLEKDLFSISTRLSANSFVVNAVPNLGFFLQLSNGIPEKSIVVIGWLFIKIFVS